MGSRNNYLCKGCGYAATVPTGESRGFFAKTETLVCSDCKIVTQVVIQRYSAEPGNNTRTDVEKCCPRCKGNELHPWSEWHICPKCLTSMKQTNLFPIMWD
jgi:hypothetical protein